MSSNDNREDWDIRPIGEPFENPCCEVPLSDYEPAVKQIPVVSLYMMLVCFISVIATGFWPPMFIIAVVAAVLAAYFNREEPDEDNRFR